MYKAAIVGVSGFGDTHYHDIRNEVEQGRAEIIAATVINQAEEPEKCAWLRTVGARIFIDWQEMMDFCHGKIDLCFLPTGIAFHAPMTIAALEAGANVFVEKPAAGTIQEVSAMEEAARKAGKFVAVGYQLIYQPDIQNLKRMLLAGHIGKIESIKTYANWCRNSRYYHRNNWAGKLRVNDTWVLDSPFNNALAHYLNLICFLAGKTFAASAVLRSVQAELYRVNPIESTDTACIRAIADNGISCCFYATHACPGSCQPVTVIVGEKGTIVYDLSRPETTISFNDGHCESLPYVPGKEFRTNIMAALRQKLIEPDHFVCGLDIAGVQTRCCNGAHESSPIHSLPPEYFSQVTEPDGATHMEIAGIEKIIGDAFAAGKLFSEIGVPWSKPGRLVDMRGYSRFAGGPS